MLYSTAYLPPISFFRSIVREEEPIIIEAHENYQKRSYRNRAYLSGANKVIHISVPLSKGKNSQQGIRTVEISYEEDWISHHLESLYTAYGQAAFFEYYIDDIAAIYKRDYQFLFEFNQSLLDHLLAVLHIQKPVLWTEDYQMVDGVNVNEKKIVLPLRTKLDPSTLNQPYYAQVFEDRYGFIPELSILDLIFCMGPEAGMVLRQA